MDYACENYHLLKLRFQISIDTDVSPNIISEFEVVDMIRSNKIDTNIACYFQSSLYENDHLVIPMPETIVCALAIRNHSLCLAI